MGLGRRGGGFLCGPTLSPALVSSNDLTSGWLPDPPLGIQDYFYFHLLQSHGFFTSALGERGFAALLFPTCKTELWWGFDFYTAAW